MEGQSQKREVKDLEANRGKFEQYSKGSTGSVIHPTSGRNQPIHNITELMEELVARPNMLEAYKKVTGNKGAPGIDGMSVEDLPNYLKNNWEEIKQDLLEGRYCPLPVKRVEIPKPNGGMRKLGIPTVRDRLIQQALHQILSPIFEPSFSDNSFGFRENRSAAQAVSQAKGFIREGKRWVVDMDLEKFFDKVNHDILMERIRRKVEDPRVLKLIRRFLQAGVMEGKYVIGNTEGTPQGGPLSPLLSNIILTDLDRELERRGHSFCRYADDCNIYVYSEKAGRRVLNSITKFLEKRLRLMVNRDKSAVERPWKRKFLGFSFTSQKKTTIRVHKKSVENFKNKVKELCRIGRGCNMETFIKEKLNPVIRGWGNYFKHADTYTYAKELDAWIRRRMRVILWRQWGKVRVKYRKLISVGISQEQAYMMANSSRGPWRMSSFSTLARAIPYTYFEELGLVSLYQLARFG